MKSMWSRGGLLVRYESRVGSTRGSVLTTEHVNPLVKKIEDTIRGPLVMLADQMDRQLRDGVDLPFKKLIRADAEDLQSMGQPPLTFYRQVQYTSGRTIGSYTREVGLDRIRMDVASCLQRRDQVPCNFRNVVLVPDNVSAFKLVLKMLMRHEQEVMDKKTASYPGVLTPIPFIPSYHMALTELRSPVVKYNLSEGECWSLDVKELYRAREDAPEDSDLRVLFVTNPGNPTGQVLSKSTMEEIIKFAKTTNLMIFADEVYQDHIYGDNKFISFKKVLREMGPSYESVELASLMSTTGGCTGEGGMRGGVLELVNLQPELQLHLHNLMTTDICLSTLSQCLLSCMAVPPKEGDQSYSQYRREQEEIRSGLEDRMKTMVGGLNEIPGYRCNTVQGGIFAFPSVELPPKAVDAAKRLMKEPDYFYAQKLLTNAGVLVLPGSSFHQRPDSHHFRCTVPSNEKTVSAMIDAISTFHKTFTRTHA